MIGVSVAAAHSCVPGTATLTRRLLSLGCL
jgi:hypothetical protein